MQSFDENIDLDVLFDSLSIDEEAPSSKVANVTVAAVSRPGLMTTEVQELSSLGGDLFLFDTPPDQS